MKLIVMIVVACLADRALACKCKAPPPPQKALEESAAVFEGTVTAIESMENQLSVTLTAKRAWKGVDALVVTVRTSGQSASCGVSFEQGKSYLVYTLRRENDKGPLTTNLCTRTRPSDQAREDVAALGEGKPIEQKK